MTLFWIVAGALLVVALVAIVRPFVFGKTADFRHYRALVASLVVVVSAASFVLYDAYGRPDLVANPPKPVFTREQLAMIVQLEQIMKTNPNDAQGWMLLARAYSGLGRIDDAIAAYRNVVALEPTNATAAAALGGLLVSTSGGTVPPEAMTLFQTVVDSGVQQPMAYYFLGIAQVQAGNLQKAYDVWADLAKFTPPGAPWIETLSTQLASVAQELGKPMPALPKASE